MPASSARDASSADWGACHAQMTTVAAIALDRAQLARLDARRKALPVSGQRPLDGGLPVPGISPLYTPARSFYITDVNARPPRIDPDRWRLRVRGMVDQPLELALGDLVALGLVELDATLVCVRASSSGDIEVCNAGHPPPLVVRAREIMRLGADGLPVGMFCSERFSSQSVQLERGETLLLYTDGLLETRNPSGVEYGIDRLCALAASAATVEPKALVDGCLRDLASYRGTAASSDDLTVMAVRRR